MSIADRRRYASAAFVTLLALSISWPSPVVSSNHLWFGQELAVDELSFLGREAPSWDVVFWCIAGLLALAIVQSGDFRGARERIRASGGWNPGEVRRLRPRWVTGVLAGLVLVVMTWVFLDAPLLAFAERIQSDTTRTMVRYTNRFGGGMNPPMIVIFFALAGLAYRTNRWIGYAAAMVVASLGSGLVAHILKLTVGRTRPELWLGPFHYARGSANSFPSGHTVGAFALAGVLFFASKSLALRLTAIALACAVGVARILAFRHWASDVVASACLGLIAAWLAVVVIYDSRSAKETDTSREQPASSIVTP
ncbi:MAG TPA: phosphatase PAP2 family protein [Thermoanaerobaculia bacterium]|nr:phosphatase PAP2 family protein [Thermoanaerobaculia bacterium]